MTLKNHPPLPGPGLPPPRGHPLPADRGPVPGPFGPGRRPGQPAIRDHLARKLLPPLAFYQTLRARGMDQAAALDLVRQETRQAAQEKKAEMASLARLPFAYTWYRLGVKKHMAKHFPQKGGETQWVRCDGKEIHFNLHTCLYQTVTQALGCPELCPCTARMTTSPSPAWPLRSPSTEPAPCQRGPCCDFHFSQGVRIPCNIYAPRRP